jgi:hypothetical protein
VFNRTNCDLFSCYWGTGSDLIAQDEKQTTTNKNHLKGIFDLTGEIFSFQYSFTTNNDGLNALLNFILIGFPILIVITAIGLIVSSRSYI